LVQILTNLISNAAKFSPRGGEVLIRTESVRPGWVRISVADRGPGIPDAFRDRIFTPFAQADSSDSRAKGGTGLGLNISKELAERMGGVLAFDSVYGQGSTFYIDLPTIEPIVRVSRENRVSVLIVEDDDATAQVLAKTLDRAGYGSLIASNLAEASALLEIHGFSAILLDLLLPDGNGLALIDEIRSNERMRDLPVIVVSVVADETAALHTSEAAEGPTGLEHVDWVNKPFDEALLLDALGRAMQRAQA
jgi:CheY-like chemotaxis protein